MSQISSISMDIPPQRARLRQWLLLLLRIVLAVLVVVFVITTLVNRSLAVTRPIRMDQRSALTSNHGRAIIPLADTTPVGGASRAAASGVFSLPDGSHVTLGPKSTLSTVKPMFGYHAFPRYAILAGTADFDLTGRWVVTTPQGTVALEPGRYHVQGVPGDSGMRLTVIAGSADAWPYLSDDYSRLHLDAGFTQWLPSLGAIPAPEKVQQQ